jgi:hypothetical protein
MRFPKAALCLLAVTAAAFAFSASARTANAQTYSISLKTYKVQVEYWFFDTDAYYWSTYYESSDYDDALSMYLFLKEADELGILNSVAPNSYWRYIAVDVRMITEYNYPSYEALYRWLD